MRACLLATHLGGRMGLSQADLYLDRYPHELSGATASSAS
jgi:ABC-type dipeptide/oligopeptide/nickel transport system ATPase component